MKMAPQEYLPPSLLFNGHLETIYPSLFRKVKISYQRERVTTPDDDFLDLDWLTNASTKLIIISHGLEGDSTRPYVTGMAKMFFEKGYDVLAWNFRGCSNEINKQLRFYHSGATDDLDFVIKHARSKNRYAEISLVGFSLGGNLTLKYLGENHESHSLLKKAVAFSVPMDLQASCLQISKRTNWIYAQRFLRSLKKKIINKSFAYPTLDTKGLLKIKNLLEFDNAYTAPLHGFANAIDYYTRSSSIHFLSQIKIPTLIVSALNDPFLTRECFPSAKEIDNSNVKFEASPRGGHCGFSLFDQNGVYWSELRAFSFISNHD
jgi:predicted alpha/beta-fold hydrolase